MGAEWRETTVGEFSPFAYGKNLPEKKRENGPYRVYGSNGPVGFHNKPLVEESGIVIGRKGTVGAVHYTAQPFWPIDTTFYVSRANHRDLRYTYYLLKSLGLENMNSDSAVPGLSRDAAHARKILVPELHEQRAIAHILGSLDDKIELNHRMNQTLEAMARAIFKHWFIDFEFPNDNGEPYKSSGGEMIDSPLGPIPKGWRIVKIKSLGNIVCGKTPPKKQRVFYENASIPFIKIPDMHNQVFAVNSNDTLSCEAINIMRKKLLPANSICVSCIATVGEVVITSRESFTNQQINSIVPRKKYLVYYTYFMMKELQNTLVQMASGGSATLNLNTKEFSNTSIIFPSESTIFRFHETVECLFQRILLNQTEINALASLRDILLPKLMSGEIRVPVSEKEDDQL
ncbi:MULTISPECIES: restriction endonuclease subunit S [unclassified Mesotoga]|uniref:restriction endonuclease subunit S n=1 Tax=unclassified Mesotoga TaxID=1184398 RepID=UPI0015D48BA1|nr:restriction endonuclease subunit S [Mesotoga sp. H07.pep.5.3]